MCPPVYPTADTPESNGLVVYNGDKLQASGFLSVSHHWFAHDAYFPAAISLLAFSQDSPFLTSTGVPTVAPHWMMIFLAAES